MKAITGIIYAGGIQTAQFFKLDYVPLPNTTLNERFGISAGVSLNSKEYPYANFWCVGVGGHRLTAAANGMPKISPIKHNPSDSGLYQPMPFVLRLESNDLSSSERNKYYLRRKEVRNGQNYYAYYGQKLDVSATTIEYFKVTVQNGVTTTLPFIPTADDLEPTAPIITSDQLTPTLADGNYVMVRATTDIIFTEQDVAEYQNAVNIILGDPELAVISEIGIYAAVIRQVSVPGDGGTITFNESCVSTLTQIVSTYENLNFADGAFTIKVDAGITRALLTYS